MQPFFMVRNYRFTFEIPEGEKREILIALLVANGFEGFEEEENRLLGFINIEEESINQFKIKIEKYCLIESLSEIKEQNWNSVWEAGFEPVTVNMPNGKTFVHIRASFHPPLNEAPYQLIITPRMSFGTGHHATTCLMAEAMATIPFLGKSVIDFGTGTGILAILAEKLGAASILAIDNDQWSINNCRDNIAENNRRPGVISLQLANTFPVNSRFQIILANINLNIILANLEQMLFSAGDNGIILLSGLLEADETIIKDNLPPQLVCTIHTYKKNGWILIKILTHSKTNGKPVSAV